MAFRVVSTANRSNIVGCQLIETFFSIAVSLFSNDLVFFIFTTRRFQAEHADNQTEHHEVDSEEDNPITSSIQTFWLAAGRLYINA